MNSLDEERDRKRARTALPGGQGLPKLPGGQPFAWSRLGLAAVLGLVAGTVLFPTPAKGRERGPPAP